jgi:VWFA-related protein
MWPVSRRLVPVALCVLSAVAISAAFQGTPGQGPVFRAGVDLVQVDVVVTDKQHQPISDLTAGDFTLSADGRPQRISTFQYVSIPIAHRVINLTQPPAPSPDVATNAPASENSRLFVMLVDDQHIIENDIAHVKDAMTEFLRALTPDDEVAMVFVGRSDLSVNFTSDVGRLLKAVDGVRGAFGFGIDAKGNDPSGIMAKHEVLFHARTALYGVKNAIFALSGSGHARRAIVLVSGFSPLIPHATNCGDSVALDFELQEAYDLAHRADVPIYTLDPRGIPNDVSASRMNRGRAPCTGGVKAQQAHLVDIAESTGGRALINRLDVANAVDEIVADNGSFYLLGYSPEPIVHDGKFHPITVKVNRPGAEVRARAGYVAASATTVPATTQQTLDQAMGAGVNVSGLTLRAFAAPIAATAKGMTTVVTVDVTYPASGGLPTAIDDELRMTVMALDPDAKVKANVARDWHVTAAPAPDRSLTVRINEIVDLPSQPLTLRIGVVSPTVGRAGTIQLPLDVPNPSSGKLQIGGVVLAIVGSASTPAAAGFDRVQALIPFQPATTRTFTLTDTVRVFAPVFWGGKDAAVDVAVTASGSHVGTPQRVNLIRTPALGGRSQAMLNLTVPLGKLAPGPCTIDVTATLPSGQRVSRVIPCSVESPK